MFPTLSPLAYLKLGMSVLILGILGFAGWKVHGWHQDSLRVATVETQAARDVAQARQALEQTKAAYAASQKASENYQHELSAIRNRPVDARPVRLCRAAPAVPGAGPVAGGSGEAVPATGVLSGPAGGDLEAGPDIGPELRELARQADEVSAQGRALQGLHP